MKLSESQRSFFGPGRKIVRASAPGRLDVMGGIADYSGSLVLEMPLEEAATATVALRADGVLRLHTENSSPDEASSVEIEIADALKKRAEGFAFLRSHLQQRRAAWAAYGAGCALLLIQDKKAKLRGADIWIASAVPLGKGVSSSAAIEVAVMSALSRAMNLNLGPLELPTLCQKVENQVVGAPCGLMDQLTSHLGRKGRLLPILCQPDRVGTPIKLPPGIILAGLDSGVRHSVGGASYGDVRAAAFMGYTLIALREGVNHAGLEKARISGNRKDLPYGGYLANIPVAIFETRYAAHLPTALRGADFLAKHSSLDTVAPVRGNTVYDVLSCARHPVHENQRVRLFSHLLRSLGPKSLKTAQREDILRDLGELMYQAHASYSSCGLGSEATDRIVDLARDAGLARGIYGAKITGGGSGGTVGLLLYGPRGLATAQALARRFAAERGFTPLLFTGSSEGARYRKRS